MRAAAALVLAVTGFALARMGTDWRSANVEAAGLAPDAARTPEAVVQVYAARAFGWRGVFGVHTWIAVKPQRARHWTVYEVIGWQLRWSDSAVVIRNRVPDARWFGSEPELLAERRGGGAQALIPRIDAAARSYPYAGRYTVWPGPNSNTFVAHVLRAVPELGASLPPHAIGKDYLDVPFYASTPGGPGLQISLYGVLGVLVGKTEGFELNLLGLTFGVDLFRPALKLPIAGRLGVSRFTRRGDETPDHTEYGALTPVSHLN